MCRCSILLRSIHSFITFITYITFIHFSLPSLPFPLLPSRPFPFPFSFSCSSFPFYCTVPVSTATSFSLSLFPSPLFPISLPFYTSFTFSSPSLPHPFLSFRASLFLTSVPFPHTLFSFSITITHHHFIPHRFISSSSPSLYLSHHSSSPSFISCPHTHTLPPPFYSTNEVLCFSSPLFHLPSFLPSSPTNQPTNQPNQTQRTQPTSSTNHS